MRKVILIAAALILFLPLTLEFSGAYFTDAKSFSAGFTIGDFGPFSLFDISPEGARVIQHESYASISCTGHNFSYAANIRIDKAKASQNTPSFILGQTTNLGSSALQVSVSFSGSWPSQGGSGRIPAGYSYDLGPGQSADLGVTLGGKINNGTPTGTYTGSILITLSGGGLDEPVEIFLSNCVTAIVS